jgi:hypothetical protein
MRQATRVRFAHVPRLPSSVHPPSATIRTYVEIDVRTDHELHRPSLQPLQRCRAEGGRDRLQQAPRQRRDDAGHAGRRDVDGGARAVAGGDDPAGEGARHQLHRRESRGGHLQPRRARLLRARAALSLPLRARRESAARPAYEPRHRYLHPRGRGHAAHRVGGAEALGRQGQAGQATARSRSSTRSIRRTRG